MKKLVLAAVVMGLASVLSAYNPPAGGQFMHNLTSPFQLSSASSAAGGGLFNATPGSIVFNPAIPAQEDRPQIDLGVTALTGAGFAFQNGIIIPMNMFVVSALVNGIFSDTRYMDLGDSLNLKAGLSKEMTERLSVGANIYTGYRFTDGGDWTLGTDIGALYRMEQLAFMKDFRIGASVLGIGKAYRGTKNGLDQLDWDNQWKGWMNFTFLNNFRYIEILKRNYFSDGRNTDGYPGIFTFRTGAAAIMFSTDSVKGGVSTDFTYVNFSDMIWDFGFQLNIKDCIYIQAAQTFDLLEASNTDSLGNGFLTPSISIGYKFDLKSNGSFMKKHNWETSEFTASAGYKQLYDDIMAVSAGANIKFGKEDEDAPSIAIWN